MTVATGTRVASSSTRLLRVWFNRRDSSPSAVARHAPQLFDPVTQGCGERFVLFRRRAARFQGRAELCVGDAPEIAAQPRHVFHADVGTRVGGALAGIAELHEPARDTGDELRRL